MVLAIKVIARSVDKKTYRQIKRIKQIYGGNVPVNKKKSSRKKPRNRAQAHSTTPAVTPWQISILIGVVILVAGVLWLKGRPTTTETEVAASPALVTPTGEGAVEAPESVVVEPATAEAPESTSAPEDLEPRPGESPEAHLDRLLKEGQPIFAFFHSNSCYQCVEMDKIVQEVYPDFAGQVALVDVNVYDDANQSLLQRAEIRVIPTLIFIDQTGQGQGATGVMPAEQLQEALTSLAAGGTP